MGGLEVTSGADAPSSVRVGAFRVSTARFPPGLRIPSHYHDWACMSILLEGRFEQRFEGRSCDCPPGVVLVKPPGERHVDRWFDAWSRHLIVEIDPGRHDDLGPTRSVAEEIVHVGDIGAAVLAHELRRELDLGDAVTPLAVEGLVLQLLAAVHRRGSDRAVGAGVPAWLLVARDFLHDNFRSSVRLADVAAASGVHPDSVSRLFPAVFSSTVGSYVRRLRVNAAAEFLATSDEQISSVALRVGFADQSHLTRVFKAAMGVTPGRYRALHRPVHVPSAVRRRRPRQ